LIDVSVMKLIIVQCSLNLVALLDGFQAKILLFVVCPILSIHQEDLGHYSKYFNYNSPGPNVLLFFFVIISINSYTCYRPHFSYFLYEQVRILSF